MKHLELAIAIALLATAVAALIATTTDGDTRARALIFTLVGLAATFASARAALRRRARRHAIVDAIDRELRILDEL
jgi:hypothetical protein